MPRAGDIIELRYDGRREESPIGLGNVKVTIRAGNRFQPVIVFCPNDSDPAKYSRSMFNLNGTRLTMLRCAVELDVPRAVATDEWSLFELGRSETVQLQECSLTVRNAMEGPTAYHGKCEFFQTACRCRRRTYRGWHPEKRKTNRLRSSCSTVSCVARRLYCARKNCNPSVLLGQTDCLSPASR